MGEGGNLPRKQLARFELVSPGNAGIPKRVATCGPSDATTRHGQPEHGATDNSEAGRQSGDRIKPRT